MAKLNIVINIGNTDENADWTKTPKKRRAEERIHENLPKQNP